MDTLQKFMDWCRANPKARFVDQPYGVWEQLDTWKWAIMDATSINPFDMPPWEIIKVIEEAQKLHGPEVLDDIQRTYNNI
jgi:hypothetical protein